MTPNEIMNALKRPFEEKQISWRVGSTGKKNEKGEPTSGLALAYIDARDVMHRLDYIFPMGWQDKYHADGNKTCCDIGLKIDEEWLWRGDGAGDTDVEAEKGAISDAFKRAAVKWGVGQYLYALPQQWFDITPAGKSWKLAGTPTLPKWATPSGYDEIMAKRARQGTGSIHAKSGVWESMDEATQRRIQGVVDAVRACLEAGKLGDALLTMTEITDVDELVAFQTRLESHEATAIRKAQGQ